MPGAILRKKIMALIELVPWGSDLYRRYWVFPRSYTQVLGVYEDYEAALAAAGGAERAAYDRNNARKSPEKERANVDRYFEASDYPALFWLSRAFPDVCKVLELGGSVGYAFYGFEQKMPYPEALDWTIVELPEAVRLGREIAAERGEHRLRFAEAIDTRGRYDVFLTSGTLQYMRETIAELIGRMSEPPPHVIVNRLPAYDGEAYWTVQNLGVNKVPYRVYSRPELLESLAKLGYSLRDAWDKPREIVIPFAPERTVTSYQGFYFERAPTRPDAARRR